MSKYYFSQFTYEIFADGFMYTAMIKFIGAFSLAGFVIPCLLTIAWKILVLVKTPDLYGSIAIMLFPLQMLFWPSAILVIVDDLTADQQGINYGILTISIIANVILYSVIGFLLWWGWNRQKWVLIVLGSAITVGWYKILRLLEIDKILSLFII